MYRGAPGVYGVSAAQDFGVSHHGLVMGDVYNCE